MYSEYEHTEMLKNPSFWKQERKKNKQTQMEEQTNTQTRKKQTSKLENKNRQND